VSSTTVAADAGVPPGGGSVRAGTVPPTSRPVEPFVLALGATVAVPSSALPYTPGAGGAAPNAHRHRSRRGAATGQSLRGADELGQRPLAAGRLTTTLTGNTSPVSAYAPTERTQGPQRGHLGASRRRAGVRDPAHHAVRSHQQVERSQHTASTAPRRPRSSRHRADGSPRRSLLAAAMRGTASSAPRRRPRRCRRSP
jgi:hypothetical protein